MKSISVVCAIIHKDNLIFVTQRGYGEYKDGWEFPGGKIEAGESKEGAIKREIKEELDAEIALEKELSTVEYDYPSFHLVMTPFLAHLKESHLVLKEHEAAKYVSLEELDEVAFLSADRLILPELVSRLKAR